MSRTRIDPSLLNNLSSSLFEIDGTSIAPSYSFTNHPTTGVYDVPAMPPQGIAAADWNTTLHSFQSYVGNTYHNGDEITLTTTGTLPSGLFTSTNYYLIQDNANHYALASSFDNAFDNIRIAFTTQGTGVHTVTLSNPVNSLGLSCDGVNEVRITSRQVFVGGQTMPTQPSELIHAEGTGGVDGDESADIVVYNTGIGGGRLIASGGASTGSPTSYLNAYSSGATANWWSGGPAVAKSCSLEFQNGSSQMFRVLTGSADTYFYNEGSHSNYHFNVGSSGTEFAKISDTGTNLTGTTTNNNAATGFIGEYVVSTVNSATSGANATYYDLTSLSLTAGDWDVTFGCEVLPNTGTVWATAPGGSDIVGVSLTSGNSFPDEVSGLSSCCFNPIGTTRYGLETVTAYVPRCRVSIASTTTVYGKVVLLYTGTAAILYGTLSARRMR